MKKISLLFILNFIFISNSQIWSQAFVKNELIVQVNPVYNVDELFQKLAIDNHQQIESYQCLSTIMHIYLIKFENELVDLDKIISYGYATSGIRQIQKNHFIEDRETIPSDTLFNDLWHLKNTGQTGGTVDADIDAPEAWDITTGGLTAHGDTIVVCLIESVGVDLTHIDLQNNIWKNYAEIPDDGIDNDNNGYVDDYTGWHVINLNDNISGGPHGTRTAGLIGASGNNVTGITGVNWNVKIMVIQGQNVNSEATVIAAYDYPLTMRKMYNQSNGTAGAFVVATNSSWGLDGGNPADSPLWCAMYDSLGFYGILNIAATTNDNANVDLVGDLPTTCPSEYLVGVTMTNSQDLRASSGYGTTHVDIAAPGNQVKSTSPGNFYTAVSGTSFATPIVTGCVALAYAAPCAQYINYAKYDPAGAALEMRTYLLESVDQNPSLQTEVASGGRVNSKKLIDSLLANCSGNTCLTPYYLIADVLSDTSVELSWTAPASDYIVWIQISGGALQSINVSGSSDLIIDTLKPCSIYTFYVQTDCGAETSILSYPVNFKTDGCCDNPTLQIDDKTNNDMTISWPAILNATAYDLRYRKLGITTWSELTDVNAPINIGGLEPCTEYEFQIKTQCTDSTQGYGITQNFRTLGCGACIEKNYCGVSGSNTSYEWINSIAINDFSNTTGNNNGWYVSNQIITALTPGNTYNVSLTAGFASATFNEGFSIWIDFNYNGIFEPSENLLDDAQTNSTLNTVISIPVSATPGITKMRIGMSAVAAPEACPLATFWGEYEDYCVYIGPQVGVEESVQNTIQIFPNPAQDVLNIQTTELILNLNVYDLSGKNCLVGLSTTMTQINIANLQPGTYIIQLETESGIYQQKFIKL